MTQRSALTIVEVAFVLVMVGLLLFIGLPALGGSKVDERRAWCLANLRQIAVASLTYANEDYREQIVPIHQSKVRSSVYGGFSVREWQWRTAEPAAFGGRTAVREFPGGGEKAMLHPRAGGTNGTWWLAFTRPLNAYALGSQPGHEMPYEVFHCPSDVGYPAADWVIDAPRDVAGIPCFDFLGNSYRANGCGVGWGGVENIVVELTSAPLGHRASSIASPLARTALYCDPLFYNGSRVSAPPDPPPGFYGWHGAFRADNVAYCDGSARLTRVDPVRVFTTEELRTMNVSSFFWGTNSYGVLRRGPSYQMDCYPTPGARIDRFTAQGRRLWDGLLEGEPGWPFDGMQQNLPPGYGDGGEDVGIEADSEPTTEPREVQP